MLSPLLSFYVTGLLIFLFFRIILCLIYFDRVDAVGNSLFLFVIGLRIDTVILCYSLIVPFLSVIILPSAYIRKMQGGFSFYFSLLASLFVFLEISTFPFMEEFYTRPDRLFYEHMVQVREVFTTIWKGYPGTVLIGLAATSIIGRLVFSFSQKRFSEYGSYQLMQRGIVVFIIVPFLFMGARSSLKHRPINVSDTMFSTSHIVNQLGLNSTYSLISAYIDMKRPEKDAGRLYGTMDPPELLERIRKTAFIPPEACQNPQIPLLHLQPSHSPQQRPYNLVIIIEESLGAEYVGCLDGLPLTPSFDELTKEGLLFTRLFATGTRTARGIEAVVSGFLPTPGKSTIKLERSRTNFFTIAELLRRYGYATAFIYGGNSHFDNMREFFKNNGIQKIYEEKDFEEHIFRGTWGVSDEYLFLKANEVLKTYGDQPFFALILTTSNHTPFEFPDGRIELCEEPKKTRHNAVKYADYSLGKFFEAAKQESYHRNTLYLIIADHGTRLEGEDLIPIHKFHIPGLIMGPNVLPGTYDKIASLIDMAPTLLDFMGINAEHPLVGRSLLTLPENAAGRAIMQYGTSHALLVDDRVAIHRLHGDPTQFLYKHGKLTPTPLDPEFDRNALAYALLPGYLYYNRLHRLPTEQPR